MAEWVIYAIVAAAALIIGLICRVCNVKYVGKPYTGFAATMLGVMCGVSIIRSVISYGGGNIYYIDDSGKIEVAQPEEYNGEKYYPQPTTRSITVIDGDTITIDGQTYLSESKFRGAIYYSESEISAKEETALAAVEFNGQKYYLQTEEPAITVVDDSTIIMDGKTYIISDKNRKGM